MIEITDNNNGSSYKVKSNDKNECAYYSYFALKSGFYK